MDIAQNSFKNLNLLDRDLSLLAFNTRVLDWAKRTDVPLLERLRYLCIVSSNLDEFFEVRAALYTSLAKPKAALSDVDRKSTRLNSSHIPLSRMPSSA